MREALAERVLGGVFRRVNRRREWHQMPFYLAVLNLYALRVNLRRDNLHDTARVVGEPPVANGFDFRQNRTPDGSFNDLEAPAMGRARTRFGRNVPVAETTGEDDTLMKPNPRTLSLELLTRREFVPASTLNVHAAGWLQFMVHDWFSHDLRPSPKPDDIMRVELGPDDPWAERPMTVVRTRPDPVSGPEDEGRPLAFQNSETHWWDASQVYGSSAERLMRVRCGPGRDTPAPLGKLYLDNAGRLPLERVGDDGREVELAGINGNWWVGLSVLHTLFAREHNTICERLHSEYPERDDEWLFQKARLIVAALLAKIHTVEWTPALLDTRELRLGMRTNWWGLADEDFARAHGRLSRSDLLQGIIGGAPDHHAAPYAITEEFVAVYRLHSLIPDQFSMRRHADDGPLETRELPDVAGSKTHEVYAKTSLEDALYSLGTEHPGALTLNNFPRHLQNLNRQAPSDRTIDLGTIDILRDRERGVPRYCRFRRLIGMQAPKTFLELTGGKADVAERLAALYDDVEQVDLLIGCLAEPYPKGFAFSDTAFRIFILMATRRLKSDRFFTTDYTPEVYTPMGIQWVADNDFKSVLLRHFPALRPQLDGVRNAFFPWNRSGSR